MPTLAAPLTAGAGEAFSATNSTFGLKIAAMAKTSSRNTYAPRRRPSKQERLTGDLSMPGPGPTPDRYLRPTGELTRGCGDAPCVEPLSPILSLLDLGNDVPD